MSTQFYDFTLLANGSQIILAEGAYFKVLTSSGTLEVRLSDGSKYGPISPGQGARDKDFKRLTLVDKSGSANSGILIVSDADFVDDQLALSAAALAALVRPEVASGYQNTGAALAANTAEVVLAAGANVSGLIVLSASLSDYTSATNLIGGLVAKATPPATPYDGLPISVIRPGAANAATLFACLDQQLPVYVPAGLGLFWIASQALTAGQQRTVRYKVL